MPISTNIFMRDGIRDPRQLADVRDIELPEVGSNHTNTAPTMDPFLVYEDEHMEAWAVPRGRVFTFFAFRSHAEYGAFSFSGDAAKSTNITPGRVQEHPLSSQVLEDLVPVAEQT